MNNSGSERISALLEYGTGEGVFPGAVLLVASGGKIEFIKETGFLTASDSAIKVKKDTIFDLASLTKPVATTLAIMGLIDKNIIDLDQSISDYLPVSLKDEKKHITVRLLLNHSAGLVDWKPFYLDLIKSPLEKRKDVLRKMILDEPLKYLPGKDSEYSDLGFMLLEWIIEQSTGKKMDQYLSEEYFKPLKLKQSFFSMGAPLFSKDKIAPTENCPWRKKVIHGEVHDENAFALGGYSGHSGLFGDVYDLFIIMDMLRGHFILDRSDFFKPEILKKFFKRQDIAKNSTWALGWDTPSPGASSSGKYFSENSIGHLGFTGASIWMDLDKDMLVIFLCNRVHPSRDNIRIRSFRPKLHDTVMEVFAEN
ncbi:serine hydrolase domain-containing protein [Thermodesulfobacteriota bacterium]